MKLNFPELDCQTKKAKTRRTKPRGIRIPKSILGPALQRLGLKSLKEVLPVARADVEEWSFQTYLCVPIVVNGINHLTNHLRLILHNSFSHTP